MSNEKGVFIEQRTDKERLCDLLNEALSGTSGRSKNTVIKEALRVISKCRVES